MNDHIPNRLARHCQQLRFQGPPELIFQEVLSTDQLCQVVKDEGICFRDRVFNPMVTFWAFLSQTFTPDASCRTVVLRLIAWLYGQGRSLPSSNTGAYCRARQRLPESLLRRVSLQVAKQNEAAGALWRWLGHDVRAVDGTTLSMPDTQANQQTYPQQKNQKPGVGFPLVRLVVIFGLSCGCVMAHALSAWRGKGRGEASLFYSLLDQLAKNDVILGDCLYSSYFLIASLRQRAMHYVGRLGGKRHTDFREGRRLGPSDRVFVWSKPSRASWSLAPELYDASPTTMEVRQVRLVIDIPGFRVKVLNVVTTLLDAKTYSKAALCELYRQRWQAELNLRSIKTLLGMDVLTGKTPAMVHKEIAMHLLTYNLIRATMALAARRAGLEPSQLSFKAAWQTLEAFRPQMEIAKGGERLRLLAVILKLIAGEQTGDRPNRVEPRVLKRRPKVCKHMTKPRHEYKTLVTPKLVA
jgi:hypothetical protein